MVELMHISNAIGNITTMKKLTPRQKTALARHKKTHGHTKKHISEMKRLMLRAKNPLSFTQAHKQTMRTKGK